MSNDFEKHSRSIANSSGFPLQIRIANVANSSPNWRVAVEEHPWHSDETNSEGFIDLVVIDRTHELKAVVIECKRVRQTAWVFLIPERKPKKRTRARLWVSSQDHPKWDRFGWSDWLRAEPSSYESKFCAIPGQEHGRQTLLERTASDHIEAVEAFAWQERELQERTASSQSGFRRVYVPVIVTTAELRVSFFEPSLISLSDGALPDDATFVTTPYIRFRKSLSSRVMSPTNKSIEEAYSASERTVFVVNAEKWREFLSDFEIIR